MWNIGNSIHCQTLALTFPAMLSLLVMSTVEVMSPNYLAMVTQIEVVHVTNTFWCEGLKAQFQKKYLPTCNDVKLGP